MSEKKRYPAEFVARVKAEFPGWAQMHAALDSGSQIVARYLEDNIGEINASEVIEMIDRGQIRKLQTKAKQVIRRKELLAEWSRVAEEIFY